MLNYLFPYGNNCTSLMDQLHTLNIHVFPYVHQFDEEEEDEEEEEEEDEEEEEEDDDEELDLPDQENNNVAVDDDDDDDDEDDDEEDQSLCEEASIDIGFTNLEGDEDTNPREDDSNKEDLIVPSSDSDEQSKVPSAESNRQSKEVDESVFKEDLLRTVRGNAPLTKSLVAKFRNTQKETSTLERESDMNIEVSLRDDENLSLIPSSQLIASKSNLGPRVLKATHVEEAGNV
ncbi:hypothetical protein L6452_19517 [Arctium lappa]|uniref:Uncharacterized protein n=1 Tax=Arctium lappa TaxID=4217 RepID=A0ACB9BAL9_ARCLA|nr:hypothetical protein L6452_19517 [Arctium lappa]